MVPDIASLIAQDWTSWTPTLGATGSMTYTSTTVQKAQYVQLGEKVIYEIKVVGTTGGTANTGLTFTLPVNAASESFTHGFAVMFISDASQTTKLGYVFIDSSQQTTATIRNSTDDNWGLGTVRGFGGVGIYEAA